jgi:hypothetical protein
MPTGKFDSGMRYESAVKDTGLAKVHAKFKSEVGGRKGEINSAIRG